MYFDGGKRYASLLQGIRGGMNTSTLESRVSMSQHDVKINLEGLSCIGAPRSGFLVSRIRFRMDYPFFVGRSGNPFLNGQNPKDHRGQTSPDKPCQAALSGRWLNSPDGPSVWAGMGRFY